MPRVERSDLRKKDVVVVRNNDNHDVVKVVFPNGIQVGASDFTENATSQFYNDVNVLGNVTVSGTVNANYVSVPMSPSGSGGFYRMFPDDVGSHIDTSVTASYMYSSGSTNDIYFTQVDGQYTNTTRMRWLESTLSSGLLHGGRLSTQNGTQTFSIEAGHGIYVDFNSGYTDEPKPVIKDIKWEAFVSQSLTYRTSYQITYIAIDTNGSIIQSINPFSDGDFNNKIILGRILHQDKLTTNGAVTAPSVAYGKTQSWIQFLNAFGPLKISGHVLSSPSGLGVVRSAGDSFVRGRNYTVDSDSPDYVTSATDIAMVTPKIFREYWSAGFTTLNINTNSGSGYAVIDPTQYNPGGSGLTAVSATSKFTIQRVYWFPNSVNKALHIYYGVAEYNSISDAEAALSSEGFVESSYTSTEAIYLGYIIVKKGCTNLSVAADAKIALVGLCRATAGGGGGGSSGGGGGGAGAPTNAQYVVLATDSTLTDERVLTAGSGLTMTDAGAGSTITLNVGAGTDITVNADDIQVNRSTLATAFAGNGLANGGSTLNVGAGTDITVNSNDVQVNRSTLATAFAGSGLSDAGSSLAVNPGTGIKITADAVAIDDSVVATVSGTTFTGDVTVNTNLTVKGNTTLGDSSSDSVRFIANAWLDNDLNVSGSLTIAQNLTVNGTTTTVNTANLVVKDPLIYFGSGTTSTNQNGGIALASGSSTAGQALVWGRVATDTWGAGKQDVTAGTTTNVTSMTLVPARASKFEVGGSTAYLSSSNSSTLELYAATQVLVLSGGDSSSTDPRNMSDVNLFVSGSTMSMGTATRGTTAFGGDLIVSGAMRSLEIDASMVIAMQMFM